MGTDFVHAIREGAREAWGNVLDDENGKGVYRKARSKLAVDAPIAMTLSGSVEDGVALETGAVCGCSGAMVDGCGGPAERPRAALAVRILAASVSRNSPHAAFVGQTFAKGLLKRKALPEQSARFLLIVPDAGINLIYECFHLHVLPVI
jgi:hypothetical protein